MSDVQDRIEAVLAQWFIETGEMLQSAAEAVVAELKLTQEDHNLPVFVEDVPRRPRSRTGSAWRGSSTSTSSGSPTPTTRRRGTAPECPDCQAEVGVHDRRHAEIVAASARNLDDPRHDANVVPSDDYPDAPLEHEDPEQWCRAPLCENTNWGGYNRLHTRGSKCPPYSPNPEPNHMADFWEGVRRAAGRKPPAADPISLGET